MPTRASEGRLEFRTSFEVAFGDKRSRAPVPRDRPGERAVRLRGRSTGSTWSRRPRDRVPRDRLQERDRAVSTDVSKARMLQLPLYAMAVERIILPGRVVGLFDVGYWGLRKDGYKPIAFEDVEAAPGGARVLRAGAGRPLRRGIFVVDSRTTAARASAITGRICRVRQARLAAKHHDRSLPDLQRAVATRTVGVASHETRQPVGRSRDGQGSSELGTSDRSAASRSGGARASVALSAGAGCGKTMVLTERFLAALDGPAAGRSRSLVALTFTEKAARELRQRIRAVPGAAGRAATTPRGGGPCSAAWTRRRSARSTSSAGDLLRRTPWRSGSTPSSRSSTSRSPARSATRRSARQSGECSRRASPT